MITGNVRNLVADNGRLIAELVKHGAGDPALVHCAADGSYWTASVSGWHRGHNVGLAPTRDGAIADPANLCGVTVDELRAAADFY